MHLCALFAFCMKDQANWVNSLFDAGVKFERWEVVKKQKEVSHPTT